MILALKEGEEGKKNGCFAELKKESIGSKNVLIIKHLH